MKLIDVRHLGRERVIGAWLVDGVLVDPGPASCLDALLDGLDGEEPRVIALTHVHLDHAGATGLLARRWPGVEVWVHEKGARHLVDPEKLVRSATRLYGDDMERLWGEVAPVPEDRLRLLDGDPAREERRGPFRVRATPGHASHHVSLLHEDSGVAFVGDVGGVRIGDGPTIAPTPPPDIDLEAWAASLDAVAAWTPTALAPTHFGRHEDAGRELDGVRAWLGEWAPRARELDQDAWVAAHRARVREQVADDDAAVIEQAAPPEQLWLGLDRYWSTRTP